MFFAPVFMKICAAAPKMVQQNTSASIVYWETARRKSRSRIVHDTDQRP